MRISAQRMHTITAAAIAAGCIVAGYGWSQRAGQLGSGPRDTLKGRIATATKLKEEDVAQVLEAIGPAIKGMLGRGQPVELPNLGTFRVVTVPEHKDMVNGRPATIPGANYVEFLPSGRFADASNLPGVVPAEVVPPFEYNPLPDQVKGLKVPSSRAPSTRTP